MKKNKKYLISSVIILSFLVINCASAETELPEIEHTSAPTNINKPLQNVQNNTSKSSLIPSLIQQELEKVKALRERTNQINTSSDGLQNTNKNQRARNLTNQTKQNRSNEIKNRRTEQIKRYVRNIAKRFRTLINRENQIKNRIQTRIEKLAENGFDMSLAKQLLSETDTNFEVIKSQIELLKNEVLTTIESPDKEAIENLFKKIKTETISLKKEIQNIHTKLVQTVKTIRGKVAEKQTIENED